MITRILDADGYVLYDTLKEVVVDISKGKTQIFNREGRVVFQSTDKVTVREFEDDQPDVDTQSEIAKPLKYVQLKEPEDCVKDDQPDIFADTKDEDEEDQFEDDFEFEDDDSDNTLYDAEDGEELGCVENGLMVDGGKDHHDSTFLDDEDSRKLKVVRFSGERPDNVKISDQIRRQFVYVPGNHDYYVEKYQLAVPGYSLLTHAVENNQNSAQALVRILVVQAKIQDTLEAEARAKVKGINFVPSPKIITITAPENGLPVSRERLIRLCKRYDDSHIDFGLVERIVFAEKPKSKVIKKSASACDLPKPERGFIKGVQGSYCVTTSAAEDQIYAYIRRYNGAWRVEVRHIDPLPKQKKFVVADRTADATAFKKAVLYACRHDLHPMLIFDIPDEDLPSSVIEMYNTDLIPKDSKIKFKLKDESGKISCMSIKRYAGCDSF